MADLLDEVGRDLADAHAPAAPIVGVDPLLGDRAEHPPVFIRRVGNVLTERRDYVHLGLAGQQFVEDFGEPADPRVRPGDVRRQQQHPFGPGTNPLPCLLDRLLHQLFEPPGTDPIGLFREPWHGQPLMDC